MSDDKDQPIGVWNAKKAFENGKDDVGEEEAKETLREVLEMIENDE